MIPYVIACMRVDTPFSPFYLFSKDVKVAHVAVPVDSAQTKHFLLKQFILNAGRIQRTANIESLEKQDFYSEESFLMSLQSHFISKSGDPNDG